MPRGKPRPRCAGCRGPLSDAAVERIEYIRTWGSGSAKGYCDKCEVPVIRKPEFKKAHVKYAEVEQ